MPNFVPKALYEQFRRVANVYFLIIAALSATPFSPVSPVTNIFPLVFVLSVSLVKEAFEDYRRYVKDREINQDYAEVIREGYFQVVEWGEVRVGDIVRVRNKENFPVDMIALCSSEEDGTCFIETMNLDGETNLKVKKSLEETKDYGADPEALLAHLQGKVECEKPNASLYTFTGNLITQGSKIPVDPSNVLLRGCVLKNTRWVCGVAVFTGKDSKVMMNSTDPPSKRSTLERSMDKLIMFMFGMMAIICLVGAIGLPLTMDTNHWYLRLDAADYIFDPEGKPVVGALNFLTLLTLFSTLIPISLYVTVEVIKFVTAGQLINKDLGMYHAQSDTPALARTSNLNEELGQIQYIFSDKTGTLTCNLMEFMKCSIAGVTYGQGVTEIQRAAAKRLGQKVTEVRMSSEGKMAREKFFNFDDGRLLNGNWRKEAAADQIADFFRCLAVCQTVMPEGGSDDPALMQYQASSPDENALVVGAKVMGWFFYRRSPTACYVKERNVEQVGHTKDCEYKVLAVLEFNSTRKRSSTIVRMPDGRVVLYCKGADNVIYERLNEAHPTNVANKSATYKDLIKFGADGLRTLCIAMRELPADVWASWSAKWNAAREAMEDREAKMDECAAEIEKELVLLGCTAIEDKLQEGVPECIDKLAKAGLQIWVLTGDKLETAINIGYACSLLGNHQKQFIISSEVDEVTEAVDKGGAAAGTEALGKYASRTLAACSKLLDEQGDKQEVSMVIDGKALQMIMADAELKKQFLDAGMRCKAVGCCRVSPMQKADVLTMVKEGAGQVTLAIGDGANDVSMIQAAHIGVGISGEEGMQAVMASDFAIAQFRFLENLLLVHGRYAYLRIAKVVGYFFYKNITYTITQFWFMLFTSYSGMRFYDDWYQSTYNLFFTSVPVLVMGLLDQDVSVKASRNHPGLYKEGINNTYFNKWELAKWILSAIWASLVVFFFSVLMFEGADGSDGRISGHWTAATAAYTYCVLVVNVRVATVVNFLTLWHHIVIWGSIVLWLLFAFVYNGFEPSTDFFFSAFTVYGLIQHLFGTSRFYLGAVLCVPAALLPDMALQALQRLVAPRDFQVVQEMVWKSIVEGPAARAAKAAAKDTEGGGEAKDGVAQAGAFVGGVEGVTRERAHTGYAFEHPGFEGASTIALYTNDNDNGMQKAKPRASDVLEQKAGIAEKKRRSSQLG